MIHPVEAADLKAMRLEAVPQLADADPKMSEALKQHFLEAKLSREPMLLTRDELLQVARWKLMSRYGDAAGLLEQNTPARIERVTRMAFAFTDEDEDFAADVQVSVLRLLPGVGMGVASAILALCYPRSYAPISCRVWRRLFGENPDQLELPEYRRYLARLRELVAELREIDREGSWTVQLVDAYCWERDHTLPTDRRLV